MSHKFLQNANFHALLHQIDQDLANEAQQSGCPSCKGKLHKADYPRSPHGLSVKFRAQYQERFSLCCADCRKRTTPPSVRFFGRYWYVAPFLLLISALTLSINKYRLHQIKRHFGIQVVASTWQRWRLWWQNFFKSTTFWIQNKGLVSPLLDEDPILPRILLSLFKGTLYEKMILLLKFLSPLTSGGLRAV